MTNFVVAILIFAGFFLAFGEPRTPPVVNIVQAKSAAAEAGLRPGDRIVAIGGRTVERFADIARTVSIRPPEPPEVQLLRAGRHLSVVAPPNVGDQPRRSGHAFTRGNHGTSPVARVPGQTDREP